MIGLIVVIEACFICPRKIEGRYTELRLDTEEKTGKKIGELPAPVYISKKRMTNGKLNSPQNISPKNKNISNSEQKSIPLYLYDIFETKLSMEYPEEYLKNKMYRDAVQSGDIEKAKKILLQEANTNGYDITPKSMEEISEITYDENGYLVPLSKRFNNKSIIQVDTPPKLQVVIPNLLIYLLIQNYQFVV